MKIHEREKKKRKKKRKLQPTRQNPVQDPTCFPTGGAYYYDDGVLGTGVRVFVTVVASLLPVCSVVALYFVPGGGGVKLCLVVAASALFSCALALMTNARMIEIFAATSAYVLWIFSFFSLFFPSFFICHLRVQEGIYTFSPWKMIRCSHWLADFSSNECQVCRRQRGLPDQRRPRALND